MPALTRRGKRRLATDPASDEEADGVGNEVGILAQWARRREAQAQEAQSGEQVCRDKLWLRLIPTQKRLRMILTGKMATDKMISMVKMATDNPSTLLDPFSVAVDRQVLRRQATGAAASHREVTGVAPQNPRREVIGATALRMEVTGATAPHRKATGAIAPP